MFTILLVPIAIVLILLSKGILEKLIYFLINLMSGGKENTKRENSKPFEISEKTFLKILGGAKPKIDIQEDSPVGFGYKTMWHAVKTSDQHQVATIFGLQNVQPTNWRSGIENAYNGSIFITPNIDGWCLVVGTQNHAGDSLESLNYIKEKLSQLSSLFGEAQFFCTHRVVEYHCWMKATNGKIDRVYSYLGESGENILIEGEPTSIERNYNLINTFSEEAQEEDYYDRGNLEYPDEDLVMTIAESWSINPVALDERTEITGLGLVGK